jgi:hypothetical protein
MQRDSRAMIGLPFSAITKACRSGSRRISWGRMIAMSSGEGAAGHGAGLPIRPGDPGLADQVGDLLVERTIFGATKHRAIEAGLAAWGISGFFVGGGLICEWAGYPLLVIDLDLL